MKVEKNSSLIGSRVNLFVQIIKINNTVLHSVQAWIFSVFHFTKLCKVVEGTNLKLIKI